MARILIVLAALLLALSLGSILLPGSPSGRPLVLAAGAGPEQVEVRLERWSPDSDSRRAASDDGTGDVTLDHPDRRRWDVPLDPDLRWIQRVQTMGLAQDLRFWTEIEGGAISQLPEPETSDERASRARASTWSELLEDLRDDDVRWNATYAGRELLARVRAGLPTGAEWEAAEDCLDSEDSQQARLVTVLLQRMHLEASDQGRPRSLHPTLRARTLAWLEGAWKRGSYVPGLTPRMGLATEVCLAQIGELEQDLVRIAATPGHGARFRAAFALGAAGRTRWSPLVAEVLVPHLRANRIEGDACMALHALQKLGPFVAPQLAVARAEADSQQRRCLEALLAECDELGSSAGHDLKGISWRTNAPLQHWTYVGDYDRTRVVR